jgi:hypothetical protein
VKPTPDSPLLKLGIDKVSPFILLELLVLALLVAFPPLATWPPLMLVR